MEYHIEHGPAFAWLRVDLAQGESIQAEAGAMVRQSPYIQMETHLNASKKSGFIGKLTAFFVALVRRVLGGETMFVNRFIGTQPGEVVLAPSLSGHIIERKLGQGETLFVQAGSYLASTGEVETKLKFTGLRSLLGGEGLALLECSGPGQLFINAYGGIQPVPISGKFVVDTGHIVAFDSSLNFKVKSVGNAKSLLFSGEGLVCEFEGHGNVYIQSRNVGALVGWLSKML